MEKPLTVGFGLTGSFCTFHAAIQEMRALKEAGYQLLPIFSYHALSTDTRFGKAEQFRQQAEEICGCPVIGRIEEAEPIGPKQLTDVTVSSTHLSFLQSLQDTLALCRQIHCFLNPSFCFRFTAICRLSRKKIFTFCII